MPAFIAFIDKQKAQELGLDLEQITNPYQIWNRREHNLGVVFAMPFNDDERRRLESATEYRRYADAPGKYYRTTVYCGN